MQHTKTDVRAYAKIYSKSYIDNNALCIIKYIAQALELITVHKNIYNHPTKKHIYNNVEHVRSM